MKQKIEKTQTENIEQLDQEKIHRYLDSMNLTSNLNKAEIMQFIEIAKAYKLNPFKREIYASKFADRFSIIVGFETYIKRAERSGKISGWNVKTEGQLDMANINQSTLKAIITIYRKDWQYPFIHEVYFTEYCQRRKDGSLNNFWREKPLTMIKKVAMAQGFRLCFSDELGGMPYTSDEIQMDDPVHHIMPEQIETIQESENVDQIINETELDIQWNKICSMIDAATRIEHLKSIYQSNPGWHNDGEFMGMLSIKRKEIEALEAAEIEKKQKQSTQKELF